MKNIRFPNNYKQLTQIIVLLVLKCLIVILCTQTPVLHKFNFYKSAGLIEQDAFIRDPLKVYSNWDAGIYLALSKDPLLGQGSRAFYPLLPNLIKIFSSILDLEPLFIGLILSNTLFLLSGIFLFQLSARFFNQEAAWFALIFLLVYPTSFYFNLIYTESLFLFLLLSFFNFLYSKKIILTACLSILIVLTRPNGILIIIPLLLYVINNIYRNDFRSKDLLLLFAPLLTQCYFLIISYLGTGDYFAAYHAQEYFVAENKIQNIFHPLDWFYRNFIRADFELIGMTNSILDRVTFGAFLALLVASYRYLTLEIFWFSFFMIYIPAFSGQFMSYMRIVMIVFPLIMQAGFYFSSRWSDSKVYVSSLFLMLSLLQIYFMIIFSHSFWVN